jgi:hypothetical protein
MCYGKLSMPKRETTFVELVNSDSRIDLDDLRLAVNANLEFNSSLWIFGIGVALTVAIALNAFPNNDYWVFVKLALAAMVVLLIFAMRRRDPDKVIRQILTSADYLDAKTIVQNRKDSKK